MHFARAATKEVYEAVVLHEFLELMFSYSDISRGKRSSSGAQRVKGVINRMGRLRAQACGCTRAGAGARTALPIGHR